MGFPESNGWFLHRSSSLLLICDFYFFQLRGTRSFFFEKLTPFGAGAILGIQCNLRYKSPGI